MNQEIVDPKRVRCWKRYDAYKESNVEWLSYVPSHWTTRPLKHVTAFVNGASFNSNNWSENGVPIIRIENLNGGDNFNYTMDTVQERYHVRKGDLLFAWSGNRGTSFGPFHWQRDGLHYLNQHIFRLDGFDLERRWFYWLLKGVTAYVEKQAHGIIGLVHITRQELGVVQVPIVPPKEQRAIAAFLDRETARIDALISRKERLIALLEEKRQSVITHSVTRGTDPNVKLRDSGFPWMGLVPIHWQVLPLKRIATRVEVGIAEAATHAYRNTGVPIIRSTNIRRNYLDTDDMYYIDPVFAEQNRSKYLRTGDLVTTRTGANLGMTAVVPEEYDRSQCFTLLIATLRKPHDSAYFCYWVNSRGNQFHFEVEGWGAGQHNLSVPVIQLMPVPIPPPDEQAKIVAYIHRVTAQMQAASTRIREGINRLQEYRTALISAAVTGQIDVRQEL